MTTKTRSGSPFLGQRNDASTSGLRHRVPARAQGAMSGSPRQRQELHQDDADSSDHPSENSSFHTAPENGQSSDTELTHVPNSVTVGTRIEVDDARGSPRRSLHGHQFRRDAQLIAPENIYSHGLTRRPMAAQASMGYDARWLVAPPSTTDGRNDAIRAAMIRRPSQVPNRAQNQAEIALEILPVGIYEQVRDLVVFVTEREKGKVGCQFAVEFGLGIIVRISGPVVAGITTYISKTNNLDSEKASQETWGVLGACVGLALAGHALTYTAVNRKNRKVEKEILDIILHDYSAQLRDPVQALKVASAFHRGMQGFMQERAGTRDIIDGYLTSSSSIVIAGIAGWSLTEGVAASLSFAAATLYALTLFGTENTFMGRMANLMTRYSPDDMIDSDLSAGLTDDLTEAVDGDEKLREDAKLRILAKLGGQSRKQSMVETYISAGSLFFFYGIHALCAGVSAATSGDSFAVTTAQTRTGYAAVLGAGLGMVIATKGRWERVDGARRSASFQKSSYG